MYYTTSTNTLFSFTSQFFILIIEGKLNLDERVKHIFYFNLISLDRVLKIK